MPNFKVGDKVRIITDCSETQAGEICELKYGDKSGYNKDKLFAWGEHGECWCEYNWELVNEWTYTKIGESFQARANELAKSWENLQVGDFLFDLGNRERKILGICGEVYFLSTSSDFEMAVRDFYTIKEFNEMGWTIKQPVVKEIEDDKTKEAIELLKSNGYKIIKK